MINLKFWQKKSASQEAGKDKEKLFPKKKSPPKKTIVWAVVSLLVVALLSLSWFFLAQPILALKSSAQKLQADATQARQSLKEKNLPQLENDLKELEKNFLAAEKQYQKISWLNVLPYVKGYYKNGQHAFVAGSHGLKAAEEAIGALSPYADMLGFQTEQDNSEETTQDRIKFILESSQDLAGKMDIITDEAEKTLQAVNKIDPHFLPEQLRDQAIKTPFLNIKEQANKNFAFLAGLKPLLENVPYFLGQEEERNYLVIFQNDAELRSTGGFLTAYAVLSVKDGQFTPVLSEDIYHLDSRFNKRIEAPRAIEEFLPNVYYWNLRDMNISPDFPTAMATFYKYYQQTPGSYQTDGIIAVDTQFLADLVEVIGPVNVSGWGTFSSQPDERCWGCPQVIYELERMADKPTSEVRADRKAVIGPLMQTILTHIMGAPSEQLTQIITTSLQAIKEKHILSYFPDEKYQSITSEINLSGQVKDFAGDYFYLNDTNFAGAKSNMFIDQTVSQEINVDKDGSITKEVTIKYANPKPASDCNLESGGLCLNSLYRNWFRIYVPSGSELLEMKGSEVEPKTYEELGKTVFEGFYGDKYPLHPNGGTSLITLKYRLPFKQEDKPYQLLIQKQPGTKNHQYEVEFGQDKKSFSLDSDTILEW